MRLPLSLTAATLALIAAGSAASAASFSLNLIGSYALPKNTQFEGTAFGGISGLQSNADGSYAALSDDRGGYGTPPRFYNLSLDYDLGGFNGVTINSQTNLKQSDGTPFPTNAPTIDPEAIRSAPGGGYYISSEGNWSSDPASLKQPFVAEFTADGRMVRKFDTPAGYDYADNATTGGRNNQLFEAMAVAPDGKVYVGAEGPLWQDGDHPDATKGAPVRVTAMDATTGTATAQYAYALPKIQRGGTAGVPGLVEMLALDDQNFIAMERAYASGRNFVSLTLASVLGATDILSLPSLDGASYTPMSRKVLLDLDDPFMSVDIDNMEAMSFGKTLSNGHRSLIIASDDNFNPRYQKTLFMAFEIVPAPVPLPASAPLMLAGVAAFGLLRRRARR